MGRGLCGPKAWLVSLVETSTFLIEVRGPGAALRREAVRCVGG